MTSVIFVIKDMLLVEDAFQFFFMRLNQMFHVMGPLASGFKVGVGIASWI